MKLKKGDNVRLISGLKKQGRVLSVDREQETIIVEGINLRYKHVKRSQRNPQGGRLQKEMPIHHSKVMLICAHCSKPTRVSILVKDDGSKFRQCKKCNQVISQISPAKSKV